jgi:hypothetical protein
MEKNLANLKVKELPYSDSKNTNGGGFGIAGAIAVIGACIYLFNNRKDFVAGLKDGFSGVEYNY